MMNIALVSPQETLYTGQADEVMVRTTCGDVKILPGHAEYLAEIGEGNLKIRIHDRIICGKTTKGIIYTNKSSVSLMLFEPYEITT